MSKDFVKSDFNKSGSTPKSLDQLKVELHAKIISNALSRLSDFEQGELDDLLASDSDINLQIIDFVQTLLGGSLHILYYNPDKLGKISLTRGYLGAEQSANVCDALRSAMHDIMREVGAPRS